MDSAADKQPLSYGVNPHKPIQEASLTTIASASARGRSLQRQYPQRPQYSQWVRSVPPAVNVKDRKAQACGGSTTTEVLSVSQIRELMNTAYSPAQLKAHPLIDEEEIYTLIRKGEGQQATQLKWAFATEEEPSGRVIFKGFRRSRSVSSEKKKKGRRAVKEADPLRQPSLHLPKKVPDNFMKKLCDLLEDITISPKLSPMPAPVLCSLSTESGSYCYSTELSCSNNDYPIDLTAEQKSQLATNQHLLRLVQPSLMNKASLASYIKNYKTELIIQLKLGDRAFLHLLHKDLPQGEVPEQAMADICKRWSPGADAVMQGLVNGQIVSELYENLLQQTGVSLIQRDSQQLEITVVNKDHLIVQVQAQPEGCLFGGTAVNLKPPSSIGLTASLIRVGDRWDIDHYRTHYSLTVPKGHAAALRTLSTFKKTFMLQREADQKREALAKQPFIIKSTQSDVAVRPKFDRSYSSPDTKNLLQSGSHRHQRSMSAEHLEGQLCEPTLVSIKEQHYLSNMPYQAVAATVDERDYLGGFLKTLHERDKNPFIRDSNAEFIISNILQKLIILYPNEAFFSEMTPPCPLLSASSGTLLEYIKQDYTNLWGVRYKAAMQLIDNYNAQEKVDQLPITMTCGQIESVVSFMNVWKSLLVLHEQHVSALKKLERQVDEQSNITSSDAIKLLKQLATHQMQLVKLTKLYRERAPLRQAVEKQNLSFLLEGVKTKDETRLSVMERYNQAFTQLKALTTILILKIIDKVPSDTQAVKAIKQLVERVHIALPEDCDPALDVDDISVTTIKKMHDETSVGNAVETLVKLESFNPNWFKEGCQLFDKSNDTLKALSKVVTANGPRPRGRSSLHKIRPNIDP